VTPKAIGMEEKTKFLLFLVSSATSLLIATGNPNCEIEINKLNVGIISIYVGYKLAKDKYQKPSSKLTEHEKEQAFENAKAEYLEFFHKQYDPPCESAFALYKAESEREIRELKLTIRNLQEQLRKEREK
jgi:hypothetical protein